MKRKFYDDKLNETKQELIQITKRINFESFLRLVAFIGIVVSFSFGFTANKFYLIALGIVLLGVFIVSLAHHNRLLRQQQKLTSLNLVCKNYLKRFDHTWQEIENDGSILNESTLFIAQDLDLVGKNSLFQYINLAKSKNGQQKLFNRLSDDVDYSQEQDAVFELAGNRELHLELVSLINMYDEKKSVFNLNDHKLLSSTQLLIYRFLAYIYPIISVVLFLLIIFNIIPLGYISILVIINLLIFLIGRLFNQRFLNNISNFNNNLSILIGVLTKYENNTYQSAKLNEIKQKLTTPINASLVLKKLVKLNERVKSQSNVLAFLLANIVIQWDYKNVLYYHNWKRNEGKNVAAYLELFFELEVLLSLGIIQQTKEIVCLPNIKQMKPSLAISEVYHPLLNENIVIRNDFISEAQEVIITGSNMSGKTTLIRSLGINLVLAYAGASVCASEFNASFMKIFTSIRIEDDFNQGISTFYAEIKRIKRMVNYLETKQPMLCLIDEIFKGTNSQDRIYGAQEALKRLDQSNVLAIVTTHDLELSELKNVVNYHFEEYYEDNEIKFDYKIKKGQSNTKNAQFLLKMAGIIK